jgi:hypothetical protein
MPRLRLTRNIIIIITTTPVWRCARYGIDKLAQLASPWSPGGFREAALPPSGVLPSARIRRRPLAAA